MSEQTTALAPGEIPAAELARYESRHDNVLALGTMPEEEFAAKLKALKQGQDRVRRVQRELMIGPTNDNPAGEDYGVIPGTGKPTLLKAGAEKLAKLYSLVPLFTSEVAQGDGVTRPHIRVTMTCTLHHGDEQGPIAGQGIGSANSWEKKYRYRAADRTCPSCSSYGTIRRSGFEDRDTGDKGWYCSTKHGGCNARFHSKDTAIVNQECGRIDNPDPYEVENTLVKIAKKRALVDAVLLATATSGLFTQDLDDDVPSRAPEQTGPPTQAGPPSHAKPELVNANEIDAIQNWCKYFNRTWESIASWQKLPQGIKIKDLTAQQGQKLLAECVAIAEKNKAAARAAQAPPANGTPAGPPPQAAPAASPAPVGDAYEG